MILLNPFSFSISNANAFPLKLRFFPLVARKFTAKITCFCQLQWKLVFRWNRFSVQASYPCRCKQHWYNHKCFGVQDFNAPHGCTNCNAENVSSWRYLAPIPRILVHFSLTEISAELHLLRSFISFSSNHLSGSDYEYLFQCPTFTLIQENMWQHEQHQLLAQSWFAFSLYILFCF